MADAGWKMVGLREVAWGNGDAVPLRLSEQLALGAGFNRSE